MKSIISIFILAAALVGCNSSTNGSTNNGHGQKTKEDRTEEGKSPGSGPEPQPPFSSNLKLNGVDLTGYSMAYPVKKLANGSVQYQLRFFTHLDSNSSYCDSSFYANEASKFSHVVMVNLLNVAGDFNFGEPRDWTTLNSGMIAARPFNTFWDAIGTFSLIETKPYRVRGFIDAKNHSQSMHVVGNFEAYDCSDEGHIRLIEDTTKNMLPPGGKLVLKDGSAKEYPVQLSFQGSSDTFQLSIDPENREFPNDIRFDTGYLRLNSGYLVGPCEEGSSSVQVVGTMSPEKLQWNAPNQKCFDSYYPVPQKFVIEKNKPGNGWKLEFLTASGVRYTAEWSL